MQELDKIIFGNFPLFFAIALLWNALAIAYLLWRRKKRGVILPKRTDPNVKFSELFASGASHKSWLTRLGGASNCLTVIVSDSHLAITTFFPFSALAGIYDLEHLIPITKITGLETKGKNTKITFQRDDQVNHTVSLRLKNTPAFLKALNQA